MSAANAKKTKNTEPKCEGCNLHLHCLATSPIYKLQEKFICICSQCGGTILIVHREEREYITALGISYGSKVAYEYRVGSVPPCCKEIVPNQNYTCPICVRPGELRYTPA